jgi:hypothetical protein
MLCPVCLNLYSDIYNLNVYNTRNRRNGKDIYSLLFCQPVSVPLFILYSIAFCCLFSFIFIWISLFWVMKRVSRELRQQIFYVFLLSPISALCSVCCSLLDCTFLTITGRLPTYLDRYFVLICVIYVKRLSDLGQ